MKYFAKLLSFRAPQTRTLLDIALILSLVPHLFALRGYMFAYLLAALYFIVKKRAKKYDSLALFLLGALLVGLSFLSNYNFSDFSKMQFFVSFISSLLILAVSLQRLSGEINFYLKISPALLMLLSFFFFDTIAMLFYSIGVFFVFVLLSVWSKMDEPLSEALRFSFALFLLSLPVVVVLFVAFPRISFEKAEFGFRGEGYSSGEYDGTMYADERPFLPSDKIVMELFFDKAVPHESALYFRSSVLHPKDASNWEVDESRGAQDVLVEKAEVLSYDALIYPHAKKWLYPLDMPTVAQYKKSELQKEQTLLSLKELYEKKRYRFTSAPRYKLLSKEPRLYLEHNASASPKTFEALRHLKEGRLSSEEKALSLLAFFRAQKLAYTTTPKNLDTKNLLDSFLFEAKNGYCTHFSASFAMAARFIGVPSRVVSGFKSDASSAVENYLVVKQKDAHAWVELYLDEKGWTRFEPTATAFINLDAKRERKQKEQTRLLEDLSLRYMYAKYLVSHWVLGFDRLKQMEILESILSDTLTLLKFVFSFLALALFSFLLVHLIKNTRKKDKLAETLEPLYKFLATKGLRKENAETFERFLERAKTQSGIAFDEINAIYNRVKYARNKESLKSLLNAIKELLAKTK